jgi:TolB-like protein
MTNFMERLKQRKLVQWTAAYVAAAWALLQVLDLAADSYGWPKVIMHLAFGAMALGLVVTVLLAWYHGERGEQRVTGVELLLLAGVFAIGGFLLWREAGVKPAPATLASSSAPANTTSIAAASTAPAIPIPAKSIAVLPFANLSGDKAQNYGISEDLLNLLARIPQLQVTARTSSFWFRGKDYTVPQIAQKLRVAYILEGSVQKAGDEVRISVQLVDAASDTQRWSQTYDRQLKDVFKIQDEIGADVVKHLQVKLLGETPKVEQIDPQAYSFYLQARQVARQGNAKALARSDALYRQALAIDPRYAAVWVGLAQNAINQPWMSDKAGATWKAGYDRARGDVLKAMAVDPENAQAQSVLGYLAMYNKFDFDTAARHFKRALALDPANADILLNAGKFLYLLNRPVDAMDVLRRAERLDPVNPDIYVNIVQVLLQEGRLKQSLAYLDKVQELSPGYVNANSMRAWVNLYLGRPGKALAVSPKGSGVLPGVYCVLGRRAEADKFLQAFIDDKDLAAKYPAAIASGYADCDEPGPAFAWLDKSVDQPNRIIPYTIYGLSFRKYHQDPRWKAFLKKVGFAPERLAKVEFDVKLPNSSLEAPVGRPARSQ